MSGYEVLFFDEVTSTNEMAKGIAKRMGGGIVVCAETQTLGRGRLNRSWFSPKGGLWFSIILWSYSLPAEALKLTFLMSLAVAKTVNRLFGLKAEVKWPNDVIINSRKVCGILAEANTMNEVIEFMVLGVGLNVNNELECFPSKLQKGATSLKHQLGFSTERETLLSELLNDFKKLHKHLEEGHWSTLLAEWKKLASFLHKEVHISGFGEVIKGVAWDVDKDGALLIKMKDGSLKRIVVGDLTLNNA